MQKLHKRENHRLRSALRRALFFLFILLFIVAVALVNSGVSLTSALSPYTMPAIGEGELRIHFLDVGQADCIVVEFSSGRALVVDGGNGSFASNRHILRYLKGLGSPALTFVATHADLDHCGGLAYLLRALGAEAVYLPVRAGETGAYKALLNETRRLGLEGESLSRYGVIADASGAYALCLSPYFADETDDNNASVVLYLSYAGVNTLLCADILSAREERLLAEYMRSEEIFDAGEYTARLDEVDILKASHHGSADSSSQQWLNLLGAETAVLSCGAGNTYGHPAPEAVQRLRSSGAELYRTDELGDIMVTISRDGTYRIQWNYVK